jgi:polysaccharide export outer membrane protein
MKGWVRRRNVLQYCAAVMLLVPLEACMPGTDQPTMPQYTSEGYHLGGGDKLRIITFSVADLTGEFIVDDQGNIALPLVGVVAALGLTPEELGQKIRAELKDKNLIANPSVSVQVIAYRPVYVLGEVNKPGMYPYEPGMTMLTAVAIAGGFTYRAVEDYAADVRTANGKVVRGNVTPNSFIAPGDVLKVYQRRF